MEAIPARDKLVQVNDLQVYFKSGPMFRNRDSYVKAVDGVSFELYQGETLALVGESGCGKTTTGKALLGLIPATGGSVCFEERDLATAKREEVRQMRRDMQFIFQDPYSSLNPRMTTERLIRRPLEIYKIGANKAERVEMVADMMKRVGLSAETLGRYPHEFSGGQRQRISIARALITNPRLVVADEPTSALDVSIQCQILDLMMALKQEFNLTMLFVSHDLSVVNYISDRTVIMYLGSVVETGVTRQIFRQPFHPYSKALLEAIPSKSGVRKQEHRLYGDISSSVHIIEGCTLCTRCHYATEQCRKERPALRPLPDGRSVACHRVEEIN